MKIIGVLGIGLALTGCVQPLPPAPPPPVEHDDVAQCANVEIPRNLSVYVTVKGDETSETEVLPRVQQEVLADFAAAGFTEVLRLEDADLAVTGQVVCSDVTRRGSRMVRHGRVELMLLRAPLRRDIGRPLPGEIISSCSLDGKGAEGFSDREAQAELAKSYGPRLRKWSREAATRALQQIAACEIRFSGVEPTSFVEKVLSISGVYDCRVRQNTAIVVYDRRAVPEGVLSRMRSLGAIK